MVYEPTLESLRQHRVLDWFAGAKFGLMIHWGPYSVPGWAERTAGIQDLWAEKGAAYQFKHTPYAEWYENTIRIDGSAAQQHHEATYGRDFPYEKFGAQFAEASATTDLTAWAELFVRAGARYAVLTSKHMDGYALWPSRHPHPNPRYPSFHSERDLVGDLTEAVRARGLKMGLYYCGGYDATFNTTVIRDLLTAVTAIPQSRVYADYAAAQFMELIERYQPSILWNDIAYPAQADANELIAFYYNTVSDGVVNDRWAKVKLPRHRAGKLLLAGVLRAAALLWPLLPRSWRRMQMLPAAHADYTTPEYDVRTDISDRKWECVRGIGHSFGNNREERDEDLPSGAELIHLLADIVSKNGNLLLGIGPTPEGIFPETQTRRLAEIGDWLAVNGEAIYDTRPWVRAEGRTSDGVPVRFTRNDDAVFAIVLGQPVGATVVIEGPDVRDGVEVRLLGSEGALSWKRTGDAIAIDLPAPLAASAAYAFRISPASSVGAG
jgi:alpha-L-fucosidase